jgi:hypothetical protein
MAYERVVMIHSFADEGMEARLRQIASNPDLDSVRFEHLAVIDRSKGSALIAELDSLERFEHDGLRQASGHWGELLARVLHEEVKPAVLDLVERFEPDVVLVHGGTVFRSATGPFLQVLTDVRELHPDLAFALEGRNEWLERMSGGEYGPFERRLITNQIRWVRQNFKEDADIDALVAAVF